MLIVLFILISAVPMYLSLQYLNQYTGEQNRSLYKDRLEALSLIAKKRVLAVIDRVQDSSALISSRTQMRISLDIWNRTKDLTAQAKIARIIRDAESGMTRLNRIAIYDVNGQRVTSTHNEEYVVLDIPTTRSLPIIEIVQQGDELLIVSLERLVLNNQIVGYMKVAFYADFLVDLITDRTGLGETGEWLFAMRHESGDALFVIPLSYDKSAAFTRRIPKDNIHVPITQALLGNEIVMENAVDYAGRKVLASTRYIPQMDWGLVLKIDEKEIDSLIQKTRDVIYLLEAVIVVLAVLVGVGVSFYVSYPIERLANHSNHVATGKFEQYPDSPGWKEIKDLTKHFNFMVKSLKDLNENLNNKVNERTEELAVANKKLVELTITDPLTGINNRRFLTARLESELERTNRYGQDLQVCLLDVDHFKSVNDTWGHDVGDDVLRIIANHLKQTMRETDIVARFGGEEYCLVLTETSADEAKVFLERVRKQIANLELPVQQDVIRVTCSFGFASWTKGDNQDEIIKKADLALYKAKNKGRNRIEVY